MPLTHHQARRAHLFAPGLFLLALLLAAGCDQAPAPSAPVTDAYGNVIGPLHAPASLASHALLGVRLRMDAPLAEAALIGRGFTMIQRTEAQALSERDSPVRLRRFWIARAPGTDAYRFPEYVTLRYVQATDGGWIVAAISHHQRITQDARRDAQGTRADLLRRFGRPSLWKQEVYRGELWDEMDYASTLALRDRDRLDGLRACHRDWTCEMVLKKNDCRQTMREGQGIGLKITFVPDGNRIQYELEDFSLLHASYESSERFRRLDVRGAFCAVPAPGGAAPIVVMVPD